MAIRQGVCDLKQLLALGLMLLAVEEAISKDEESFLLASEEDYFRDIPVVVTATRLAQPTNSTPAAVTVIDRQMIEASGAVEIVDVLRLVPGFQVAHTHGNLFTVSVHGTGAPWFSRVQVLVDGHSVYNTAFSGLDWANVGIALKDIERIEVVRGPNIATYGANAIQGTVNIITRQPFQDRGAFIQTTIGEPGRRDGVLRYAGEAAGLDYRVTLEHRQNDGFADRNDSTNLNSLNFRGVYNPTVMDELDMQLGFTRSEMGVQLHFDVPYDDRSVETNYQFIRWTRSTGSEESWYVQFSRDYYDTDEDTRFPGPYGTEFSFNNFDATSNKYDIELQHFFRPHDSTRLAWGLGYRWDSLQHFLIDDQDEVSDHTGRLFANLEWSANDKLLLNLGGMYESSDMVGGSFSPRLGLNYFLDEKHTLRTSISRGNKTPSLLEEHWHSMARLDDGTPLYLYHTSEGDLQSEQRDVFEVGYLGRWLDNRLNLNLRLYHEEVEGAVIYAQDYLCPENPSASNWCYRVGNYMDYQVDGLELEFAYRTSPDDLFRLQYAYADVDGEVPFILNPEVLHDLNQTAPLHSFGLLASRRLPQRWQLSGAFYYVSETDWYIDGSLVDEYSRLDLRIAKGFKLDKSEAKLELIAQNLMDDYNEFSIANTFETRWLVRAEIQFE